MDCMNDSFSCDKYGGPAGGARPFPSPRGYPGQHVGSVHAGLGAAERPKDLWAIAMAIAQDEHAPLKQPAMCCDWPKGEAFESGGAGGV